MRVVPDWTIQLSWWISGIFATGAGWYFLSKQDFAFAAASGAFAILFASVAIGLHRKKDAIALALIPAELKDDLPEGYIRRSTSELAQVRLVNALPELKLAVYRACTEGWSSPVTLDMREANYDMVDFLEFTWLKLAEFYPRNHFAGKDAEKYIRQYIRDRFSFHWSKHEPAGPGSGGTIVGVLAGGDVISDLEGLIQDTMHSLFFDSATLDLDDWMLRWKNAGHEPGDA